MDESWRMRMGMDPFIFVSGTDVDADDFADVFGGPPRSVLTGKLSGHFSRSKSFYEEIFSPPELGSPQFLTSKSYGRSLPAFRIPSGGDGFYGDVFGSSGRDGRRGRERSLPKSISSSGNVSPFRPPRTAVSGDDVAFCSFSSSFRAKQPLESKKQRIPAIGDSYPPEKYFFGGSSVDGFSLRASPETISLDLNSFRSIKLSMEDFGPSSPASSPVPSVYEETEPKHRATGLMVEEEDEVTRSYVIDMNRERGGGSDSTDIDEAIAWAKESFLRSDMNPEIIETELHVDHE